jgi:hypothetical protein
VRCDGVKLKEQYLPCEWISNISDKGDFLMYRLTSLCCAFLIVLISVFGVFSYSGGNEYVVSQGVNILPAKNIMYAVFFLILLSTITSLQKKILPFFTYFIIYLSVTVLIILMRNNIDLYDFILIFSSFLYSIAVCFASGKYIFTAPLMRNIFIILLVSIFIKYSYMTFFSYTDRPELLIENNIELQFLMVLFLTYNFHYGRDAVIFAVMAAVILLSGSLSAIITYTAICSILLRGKVNKAVYYVFVLMLSIALMYVFFVKVSLWAGFENVDRYLFFLVFLDEFSNFNIAQLLFGFLPITELSSDSCGTLAGYQALFSNRNDGTCFSPVLHGFSLRFILDHGLLSLLILIILTLKSLKHSGYGTREALSVISIILLSGLSVSSFSSVFFIVGFLIMLTTFRNDKSKD